MLHTWAFKQVSAAQVAFLQITAVIVVETSYFIMKEREKERGLQVFLIHCWSVLESQAGCLSGSRHLVKCSAVTQPRLRHTAAELFLSRLQYGWQAEIISACLKLWKLYLPNIWIPIQTNFLVSLPQNKTTILNCFTPIYEYWSLQRKLIFCVNVLP